MTAKQIRQFHRKNQPKVWTIVYTQPYDPNTNCMATAGAATQEAALDYFYEAFPTARLVWIKEGRHPLPS